MKRDMELVRDLLSAIESDPRLNGAVTLHPEIGDLGVTAENYEAVAFHLDMMIEVGLVEGKATMQMPMVRKLTWKGYDFIEATRNPEIWSRTKAAAQKVGGVGLDLLVQIAKAEGKRLITEKLGIPLS